MKESLVWPQWTLKLSLNPPEDWFLPNSNGKVHPQKPIRASLCQLNTTLRDCVAFNNLFNLQPSEKRWVISENLGPFYLLRLPGLLHHPLWHSIVLNVKHMDETGDSPVKTCKCESLVFAHGGIWPPSMAQTSWDTCFFQEQGTMSPRSQNDAEASGSLASESSFMLVPYWLPKWKKLELKQADQSRVGFFLVCMLSIQGMEVASPGPGA